MAENWCKEHNEVWFKKGAMKGFAHPLKDENGDDIPGKWCNRPRDYIEEDKPTPKVTESKYKADPDKINSIEGQCSLKCATELLVNGKIEKEQWLSYAEAGRRFLSGDIKVKDEEVFVTLMGKHFKLGE